VLCVGVFLREIFLADRQLYLGIVERLHRRSEGQPAKQRSGYALLRPLYKASADFSEWLTIENAQEDFPNRGFVTWYAPPQEIAVGSVWQFRIEESFTYEKDNPEHDRFFAAKSSTPAPAREVIDWRREDHSYDVDMVRRDVAHEGLWLSHPPSPLAYLWVHDQTLIGPMHLSQQEGKWRVPADQTQQRLVSEFSIPEERIAELRIAGAKRYFLTPGAQTGSPVRSLDWSPDDIVLRRVLQWLKKTDPGYAATANLTKEVVNRAASLVRGEAAADGDAVVLTQQLRRVLALVSTLEENASLAQKILEDLLSLPSVTAIINEASDAERQSAREQIHAELASVISQVDSLRADKASLEEQIRQLEIQRTETAEAAARQIEESRATLEAAIAEQLSEVMNRPAQALAQIAILRTALGLDDSSKSSVRTSVESAKAASITGRVALARMWLTPNDAQIKALNSQNDFQESLGAVFESRQFGSDVGRTLHAAFMSGAMPVVAGDASYEAVQSYASCAAGGKLLWIPVAPSVFEPSDLLGKFSIESGRFIPHPGGLLDLLLHARSSDELYVVVLDGINRAPIDAYLNPLLSLYSDVRLEERRRRMMPLLPAGEIEPNNPYSAASQLAWPPNVLLAGIWSKGSIGLPTPSGFWDAAALISVEQSLEADQTSDRRTDDEITTSIVSPVRWSEWQQANQKQKVGSARLLPKLLKLLATEGLTLSRRRAAVCSEFYAAVSQWTQSEAKAIQDVSLCCLAPRLLASGHDFSLLVQAVEQLSGTSSDFEARLRKVQILMS
jgi:hypothetical protein